MGQMRTERNRGTLLTLGDGGHCKSNNNGFRFPSWKELTQFRKRSTRQGFDRTEMKKQSRSN